MFYVSMNQFDIAFLGILTPLGLLGHPYCMIVEIAKHFILHVKICSRVKLMFWIYHKFMYPWHVGRLVNMFVFPMHLQGLDSRINPFQ